MNEYTMTTSVRGPEARMYTSFDRTFDITGGITIVKEMVELTTADTHTEKVIFNAVEPKVATVRVSTVKSKPAQQRKPEQQQLPQPQQHQQQPQKTLKQQLESNTQVPLNPTSTYHPTTNELANLRIDAKINLDKLIPKLTTNQLIQLANFARILSTNFLENTNQQSFQLPSAPALPLDRQNEILLSNMPPSSYPCRCRICNARLDNPLAWLSHMDNHTAFDEPPAKRPK